MISMIGGKFPGIGSRIIGGPRPKIGEMPGPNDKARVSPTRPRTRPVGSNPLMGTFGSLMSKAGGYASVNPSQLKAPKTQLIDPSRVRERRTGGITAPTEARTGAINPHGFNANSVGGINWGAFGDSEIAKRFAEGADLANAEATRTLFGDTGIGGAFGEKGSKLAGSGLLSSSAMGRLANSLGGELARTTAMNRNKAALDALNMYGGFATSDLGRKAQELQSNAERAAGIARQNQQVGSAERTGDLSRILSALQGNQQVASTERTGDLNRLKDILERNMVTSSIERTGDLDRLNAVLNANANRRQAGIDRDVRTTAGAFDMLMKDREADKKRKYDAAKYANDLALQLATGLPGTSTQTSTGANPFFANLMGGLGKHAGGLLG